MNNEQTARDFLKAIEEGRDAAAFYALDALFHEHPNALVPHGATRDLDGIRAAGERGKQVVRDQRYEVESVLSDKDQVAMRVKWSATLLEPGGGQMSADFGMFLRFRDGKIVEQHNYDCFQPL